MKKLLTALLSIALAITAMFSFTACKKDDSKPTILTGVTLVQEQYGIAAKQGNEALVSKVNEALIALADNQMQTIAGTYGLTSEVAVTSTTANPLASASDSSWTDLVSRNKVVIGYTVFAPIAYDVVNDVPTKGYDIELANAVFAYLNTTYGTNIQVEFLPIKWSEKESMLAGNSIDLVWNGLTITAERSAMMCISVPYLNNKQVALTLTKNANKFATIASMHSNFHAVLYLIKSQKLSVSK